MKTIRKLYKSFVGWIKISEGLVDELRMLVVKI